MSFKPIQTDSRRSLGVRFGYAVREAHKKKTARLRLSIGFEIMKKTGWADGDMLRLDVDATAGLGRLLQVITTSSGARRLELRSPSTGRGHFEMPWTGEVPHYFTPTAVMTELEVVEIKAGELTFELPIAAKREGGES